MQNDNLNRRALRDVEDMLRAWEEKYRYPTSVKIGKLLIFVRIARREIKSGEYKTVHAALRGIFSTGLSPITSAQRAWLIRSVENKVKSY